MGKDYTYAVARIRGRELSLFGGPVMEQLLACKTCEEALRFLADKGWGSGQSSDSGKYSGRGDGEDLEPDQ